jgi:CheY-like chemotaxis protein
MAKILLIEDDPQEGRMYQRLFETNGYELIWAKGGKEGVEQAKTILPDLIYLDIMMPEMNGFTVLEILKSISSTRGIPVIVLSNLSEQKDIEMALAKGAIRHLVKANTDEKTLLNFTKDILSAFSNHPTSPKSSTVLNPEVLEDQTKPPQA